MMPPTDHFLIFECRGDLAKNILATAVVSSLKKAHPTRNIVVISPFPEVWIHNPNVYRYYVTGQLSYFYEDYVTGKDTIMFRHDPVQTEDYAYDRKHLIEIWCDLCKVPYDGSLPQLYFTLEERNTVKRLVASDKPLFFIQTNKPTGTQEKFVEYWPTDIPQSISAQIIRRMNEKGYMSVHLRSNNHPTLPGTVPLTLDTRQTLCAFQYSDKRLCIDSYSLQIATALGLHSVVLWIAHKPKLSGYDMHVDIYANTSTELKGYIENYKEGYDVKGNMRSCPYDRSKIFDVDEVVKKILLL
jgi:hypothetical protein